MFFKHHHSLVLMSQTLNVVVYLPTFCLISIVVNVVNLNRPYIKCLGVGFIDGYIKLLEIH